jgi:hypothetical protein
VTLSRVCSYAPERERVALLELVGGEAAAGPDGPSAAQGAAGAGGASGGGGGAAGGVIDLRYLGCDWALALPQRTALLAPRTVPRDPKGLPPVRPGAARSPVRWVEALQPGPAAGQG